MIGMKRNPQLQGGGALSKPREGSTARFSREWTSEKMEGRKTR
jgi:hypothetical protein